MLGCVIMYNINFKDELKDKVSGDFASEELLRSIISTVDEHGDLKFDDTVRVMASQHQPFIVYFDRVFVSESYVVTESDAVCLEFNGGAEGRALVVIRDNYLGDCFDVDSGNMLVHLDRNEVLGLLAIVDDIISNDIDDEGYVDME